MIYQRMILNDGRCVLMFKLPDGKIRIASDIEHIFTTFECKRSEIMKAWRVVGITPVKACTNFGEVSWDYEWTHPVYHTPFVFNATMMFAGEKDSDIPDVKYIRRWYVNLDRDIIDIPFAFDPEGYYTDEFFDYVTEGLWDYNLQSATGLSAISPTGRYFTTISIKCYRDRVIVTNEVALDC